MKLTALNLDRKQKFQINAVVIGTVLYFFANDYIKLNIFSVSLFFLYVVVSVFIVHYPNLDIKSVFTSSVLPVFLLAGAILSLHYFPNLTKVFKIVVIAIYTVMYYIVSLVDNIFLVVSERKEVIPLYRVAVTWSQIMIVIIGIPFYAGVFKISINSLFQSIIIFISAFIFGAYLLWATKHDSGMKNVKVGEGVLLSLFQAFIVFASSLAVSFFPNEAFLRGLFVCAVLMFSLNYIFGGYLKNDITKRLVFEYIFILLLFLFLTVIFI
jgi:hypothetical protein